MNKLCSDSHGETGNPTRRAPNAPRPAPALLAANELTLHGEWLKICPWGDFPNKVGLQRVTQRDGDAMVAAFNSLRGRLARGFLGLPVYVGHPDVQPADYPDKRRYGKITDLETRGDGLYGKVAWNDLGRTAIEQGHYLFNSPTWYLKREDKFVRPVELVSVGLTNTPQIPGDAWAKNIGDQGGDQGGPSHDRTKNNNPSISPTDNRNPNPTTPMPDPLPDWLKTILITAGLIQPDATVADATAALTTLTQLPARVTELEQQLATCANERDRATGEVATATAQMTTLTASNAALTTERDTLLTDRRERELELAINSGRIATAERAAWNAKLTADFAVHAPELRAKSPTVSTQNRLANLGARKGEGASDKLAAINEAVSRYAAAHKLDLATNDGHNAAYHGAKRQNPVLFK